MDTEPTIITDDSLPDVAPAARKVWAVFTDFATDTQLTATIRLSDNTTVQALNKQFRGKDKPTNVLSFLDGEEEGGVTQLGDIILAQGVVVDEAAAQQKSYDDHLVHLILHGLLHLYGYDHEEDAEAEEMEALEVQLLQKLGVANPYETK